MGTRSLICVYYRGRFVVAQYTQFDGYPEGQGLVILKFLRNPENIQRLKDGLEHVYVPSPDELAEIDNQMVEIDNRNRAENTTRLFRMNPLMTHLPSLSRETGGGILELISNATAEKRVPITLDLEFANDGLFCEWAYVVDLDKELFETYGGPQRKSEAANKRWQDVGPADTFVPIHMKTLTFAEAVSITDGAFVQSFAQMDNEDDDDGDQGDEDEGNEDEEENEGGPGILSLILGFLLTFI